MEKTGMGTLLSVIFLILGTTFLPEPVDAAPTDYQYRDERSASPNPRCPNCPKDCPESLSGGISERESEAEQYSSPYNSVQSSYRVQSPSLYSVPAPQRPPSPAYGVASSPSYGAPPQPPPASYAPRSPEPYPSAPMRPPYSVPPPSYEPPAPAYGAPPTPPPPPASFAAPPPPPAPPASYNPAPPAPPASYNPAPPAPPASYNSAPPAPPASYSPSQPTSYNSSPSTSEKHKRPPPAKSPCRKLPPPPAIPNEPPLSSKPFFKRPPPPPPPPKPEIYDLLPLPRYNHLVNSWTPIVPQAPFRNFNYNPYEATAYRSNYLNARPTYSYSCGGFDLDDEDDAVFNKYNRRSSDNRFYRHSGHHQDHFVDPLNSPSSMYKNYRPYEREEGRSVFSDEFGSEESSSSKDQPRERLYVVYRADAMKKKSPSSSAPMSSYLTEDHSMTDREIESMIRRAIDISRQQRTYQDNVLYNRADPSRYQYQHVSQQLDASEQPEFKSLSQQQYESQYPLGYQLSPVQMMDNEDRYVVREEGDEANNPGWDQNNWTAVTAMSGDFVDNPENVYAANVGVSNGASVTTTQTEPADAAAAAAPSGEEAQHPVVTQPDKRLEKKETGEPEVKETKTEEVDLIEDMETPQTVTEASSFDKRVDTTTDDGVN